MAESTTGSMLSFLGVNNKVHNSTDGFWGVLDTTHAFCEPHYAQSWYFAEFYNSISSLVYCAAAWYLLKKLPGDRLLQTANVWLAVLGTGSMLFHCTMKYSMQLLDEGPMVGWMTTIILAQLSCGRPFWLTGKVGILQTIVVVAAVALVVIYGVYDEYEIFVHGFSALALVSVFLGVSVKLGKESKLAKLQQKAMIVCIVALVLGKICWEFENRLCEKYPAVWPLHTMWHFFSCTSAYAAMINAYLCRVDDEVTKLPDWFGFRQQKVKSA
jgi:dihydroceramidase